MYEPIWKNYETVVESLTKWADDYGWDVHMNHAEMTRREMVEFAKTNPGARALVEKHIIWPPHCSGCGKSVDIVFVVGAEPDYDSSTAQLCIKCMRWCAALAEAEFAKHEGK